MSAMRVWVLAVVAMAGYASASSAFAQAPTLPDPSRTPGAINPVVTQANIHATICVRGWTKTVRPPEDYTYRLKREQLRAWDYVDQQTRDYEEDHLIPLALGGRGAFCAANRRRPRAAFLQGQRL